MVPGEQSSVSRHLFRKPGCVFCRSTSVCVIHLCPEGSARSQPQVGSVTQLVCVLTYKQAESLKIKCYASHSDKAENIFS